MDAFHKIAKLYLKEGLAGNAKNYYQSILQINPNDFEAIKGLRNIESPQQPKEKAFTPSAAAIFSFPDILILPSKICCRNLKFSSFSFCHGYFEVILRTCVSLPLDKDSEMHYHLGVAYKKID